MYFLNDMCDSSDVLRLFYVIKLAFYALQIILPLLCIFIMMKRCFSALISDDTQKKLKDLTPQTLKMLAAAFIFFFVPVIVEYAINGLGENDVDFASCFVEAELDNIKSLEEQELSSVSDERNFFAMNKIISFPHLGDYHVPIKFLLTKLTKCKVIQAPPITKKTIELGSKYSPDFVCVPFKYNLGNFIEALDNGANILIQAGGGCRYGYYGELQCIKNYSKN